MSNRIPPPSSPMKPLPGGGLSKLSSTPEINHLLGVHVDSDAECSICVLTTERDQLQADNAELETDILEQHGRVDVVSAERDQLQAQNDLWTKDRASFCILVNEQQGTIDQLQAGKDQAYAERNKLVALLAAHYPSALCKTDIEGWDPEWHWCVFIETPEGQLSWHIHESECDHFYHVERSPAIWDGHTTKTKYERVFRLAAKHQEPTT